MSYAVGISLLVLLVLVSIRPADDPSEGLPDIQSIASAVRAQERLLLNLQIAAHHDCERWNDETAAWTYAGEADLRAWLTGEPGKVRIDYERQITTWVDGPAPFAEDSYRVAFNGQVSKRLQTRTGMAGSPSNVLSAELAAGPPPGLGANGGFQSGWQFSALGASPNGVEGVPFSDYLTLAQAHAPRVEVFEAETAQQRCVAVRIEEPNGQQRIFYFDSAKAYTLVGGEFRFPSGATGERWTAHELQYLAPGLYFPTQVVRELFTGDGQPRERSTFYASEIIANDPAWTDDVFDPPWPAGTVINDKISGTVYQVGPSPQQLEAAVDAQIGDLLGKMRPREAGRSQADQPPAAAPIPEPAAPSVQPRPAPTSAPRKPVAHPNTQPTTRPEHTVRVYSPNEPKPEEPARDDHDTRVLSPLTQSNTPTAPSHHPELLVVLLGTGALAIVAVVLARGRRAGPLVLLICVGLSRSNAGDDRLRPLSLPQLGPQKLSNCGLNAAVFVCRHFQVPSAVDALAAELAIGDYHQRPASLLALKQAFVARGLSVEAYRDARIEEIASALDGASLWLLHVDRSAESPGHFYILAGRDPEGICWIDPVNSREWTNSTSLAAELEGKFSGWCLRIGPPEPNARASQPGADSAGVAWFPEQVNLGVILPEQVLRTSVTITFVVAAHAGVYLAGCTDGLELARECIDRESGPGGEFAETKIYSFRLRERGVGLVEETLTFRATARSLGPIVIPVRAHVRAVPAQSAAGPAQKGG